MSSVRRTRLEYRKDAGKSERDRSESEWQRDIEAESIVSTAIAEFIGFNYAYLFKFRVKCWHYGFNCIRELVNFCNHFFAPSLRLLIPLSPNLTVYLLRARACVCTCACLCMSLTVGCCLTHRHTTHTYKNLKYHTKFCNISAQSDNFRFFFSLSM